MAALPRIVSLLPSATEIAVAVGLGEGLVGRSHECDFPPFVEALPVCTATKLEKGLTSLQIDDRVQEIVRQGLSVYEVDAQLLRSLRPDVILTQSQCAVCAVTPRDLEEALSDWVGTAPLLLSLAPDDLGDVWGDFRQVGEAVGAVQAAEAAVGRLQERMHGLQAAANARGFHPSVAAIEWIDPLMAAGNWVPELIQIAGGVPLFATPGQHSPWLEWDALVAADPDIIVMMPCGYQIPQALADLAPLIDRPGWRDLSAVRHDMVFVADGHHYFNRPGPRLVESAQIIAETIAAATSGQREGGGWLRLLASWNRPEPVLMCWSGGKDSCVALHALQQSADHHLTVLLTTVTRDYDRISMHGVRVELLDLQAAALGLPVEQVSIPAGASNDVYEKAMADALSAHAASGVRTVAFGDLFLEDIRAYRERMVALHGMAAIFPVWGRNTRAFVQDFIAAGFRAVLVCVDLSVLDAGFAGRTIDAALLADLPRGRPCGENGEFHTFVFDGPNFAGPIEFALGERVTRDGFCFCDLVPPPRVAAA